LVRSEEGNKTIHRILLGFFNAIFQIFFNLHISSCRISVFQIASIDPFGHIVTDCYADWLKKGWDIRPTIAVTKAHIDLPECREAIATGRIVPDGKILMPSGQSIVSKAAIEPVWYLPEIARRFETTESNLRQSIFRMTNGETLSLQIICLVLTQ
jgi:hypothetical protein